MIWVSQDKDGLVIFKISDSPTLREQGGVDLSNRDNRLESSLGPKHTPRLSPVLIHATHNQQFRRLTLSNLLNLTFHYKKGAQTKNEKNMGEHNRRVSVNLLKIATWVWAWQEEKRVSLLGGGGWSVGTLQADLKTASSSSPFCFLYKWGAPPPPSRPNPSKKLTG